MLAGQEVDLLARSIAIRLIVAIFSVAAVCPAGELSLKEAALLGGGRYETIDALDVTVTSSVTEDPESVAYFQATERYNAAIAAVLGFKREAGEEYKLIGGVQIQRSRLRMRS